MRRAAVAAAAAALTVAAAAGCGGGGSPAATGNGHAAAAAPTTTTVQVVRSVPGARFDAASIYRRDAPGVVTVLTVFRPNGLSSLLGGGNAAEGSGFVISPSGEVVTNAHVVTNGQGAAIQPAQRVYVKFADGNEVQARIVGYDPNADVALLRIDPSGLNLRPLALGSSGSLTVGAPVAAIGSPFGEAQSLSVGVISGTGRSIDSLTGFQIAGAIQTDAAINHGNSGGPLLDAGGRVLGINSQIQSTGGGGEGVGFAVPIDLVRRSIAQLRATGRVGYAFLGVETSEVYPQLARRFGLGAQRGAWIQRVTAGGPAARAGLRGGHAPAVSFQDVPYRPGGDVIVAVGGRPIRTSDDLSQAVLRLRPGRRVAVTVARSGGRRTVSVLLASRPRAAR